MSINDYLVISESEFNKNTDDLKFVQLGLSAETLKKIKAPSDMKNNIINDENKKYESKLRINNIPISDISESFLINNFFHKYMSMKSKDINYYKITNAIGNLWFKNNEILGIMYPNINSYFNNSLIGYNVAIKPDIVDKFYHVKKIWIVKLLINEKLNNDKIRIGLDIIKSSNKLNKNNDIIWEKDPYSIKLPTEFLNNKENTNICEK